MPDDNINKYARFLRESGVSVVEANGVFWHEYSGFFVPAYFPHCCPEITQSQAKKILRIAKTPFVRWTTHFGRVDSSPWWYVLKRGTWQLEDIKNKKKRWMIRQGRKNFTVRHLSYDEAVEKCPEVAMSATKRYEGVSQIDDQGLLKRKTTAGKDVEGTLEYMGCFQGDRLVSYSENHIQDNAVWLYNIHHDPSYLKQYSSYCLMDGILHYYLNEKKTDYVLDGSRSILHRTNFQDHIMSVFGFEKEYAVLNMLYSGKFGLCVKATYPFKRVFELLAVKYVNKTIDNINAVLRQEEIRRECVSCS